MKKIQVLIPLYNEETSLSKCLKKIHEVLVASDFAPSFILVDDGSKDGTWNEIKKLSEELKNINALRFSRNFGKEIALMAGVRACENELTVIMDSDLQHPPECISHMYELMQEKNADVVEGYKINRGKESLAYKVFARTYYRILKAISGLDMDNSSDFKLLNAKVIESLKDFDERHVFFRGLVDYVGFNKEKYDFEVADRAAGKTSFNMRKLGLLALDAVLSYTGKLLYLVFISSLIFMLFSLIMIVQTLYNYFSDIAVSGFSTVIIILLVSGSLIMLSLGIIGLYLSRIYTEVKGRPLYVIKDSLAREGEDDA